MRKIWWLAPAAGLLACGTTYGPSSTGYGNGGSAIGGYSSGGSSSGASTTGGGSSGGTSAAGVSVEAKSFSFTPSSASVGLGATVTWHNVDKIVHTVTSGAPGKPDGKFNQSLQPGQSFTYTFTAAGSYPYFCSIHYRMGMVGSVTVSSP